MPPLRFGNLKSLLASVRPDYCSKIGSHHRTATSIQRYDRLQACRTFQSSTLKHRFPDVVFADLSAFEKYLDAVQFVVRMDSAER